MLGFRSEEEVLTILYPEMTSLNFVSIWARAKKTRPRFFDVRVESSAMAAGAPCGPSPDGGGRPFFGRRAGAAARTLQREVLSGR